MANYVDVNVVCPCGRLLFTRKNNAESKSTTSGSQKCPSCKQNVAYQIRGASSFTSYKK